VMGDDKRIKKITAKFLNLNITHLLYFMCRNTLSPIFEKGMPVEHTVFIVKYQGENGEYPDLNINKERPKCVLFGVSSPRPGWGRMDQNTE
jgi:hypothetical protein